MKHVSDIISFKEIGRWNDGDKILISTPTGSGKTTFIFNVLYPYCVEHNYKILYFSNRTALKNQVLKDIRELGLDESYIMVKNYQQSERRVIDHNVPVEKIFEPYKFVILDEAHYIIADSYNRKTDVFLDVLKYDFENQIRLFITATPQAIKSVSDDFDYVYTEKQDYSFIKHLYFYGGSKALDSIIYNVPEGEKAIYFGRCEEGLRLKKITPNSAFTCSNSNKEYYKYCNLDEYGDDETIYNILANNRFEEDFLFCTQVLDNGVSLHDPLLKHIIIDQIDPIILLQCLGRKRLTENERVTVYVREYNGKSINGYIKQLNDSLEEVELAEKLGSVEFLKEYKRKRFDTAIFSDGTVNLAKKTEILYKLNLYSDRSFQYMYANYVAKMLGQKMTTVSRIDDYLEVSMLENLMKKYEGIELIETEDKSKFQEMFFECFIKPKGHDYRSIGLNTMNSILSDLKIDYLIVAKRKLLEDKKVTYWVVK